MRRVCLAVLLLAAFTLVFAPSREIPPALPEPGAQRIVARAFGVSV